VLHENPQVVPLHVAEELAGAEHAVHIVPHDSGLVLLTHAPLHRWNPALHTKPQAVPSHVAVALAGGAGHAVHDVPQLITLVLLTHAPLQT
jgi:hypothetical protein